MANSKVEIPWWDEWYNADSLERIEMVKKLSISKNFIQVGDKKENEIFPLLLNSFFEDLADYMGSEK